MSELHMRVEFFKNWSTIPSEKQLNLAIIIVFDFENREELKNILWKMWKNRNPMWLQKDFDLIVRSASWDLM